MKSHILVASCVVLLGACASTPTAPRVTTPTTSDATPPTAGSGPAAYGPEVDGRTIDAVNRVARVNGVEVHWINYPQARPTAGATAPATPQTGT